jgi:hypothetical protein
MLAAIYAFEISEKWAYLGFLPLRSISSVLLVLFIACVYALFLSKDKNFRNLSNLLTHYIFFIPGLILSSTYNSSILYLLIIILSYTLILIFSKFPSRAFRALRLSNANFVSIIMILSGISVAILVALGALSRFNINILKVYDFRADTMEEIPNIFVYLFFSVAKAVLPLALIIAIYFRSASLVIVSAFLIILMFGMLHQKTILFLPFVAAALYLLSSSDRVIKYITYGFIFVVGISSIELIILKLLGGDNIALYTSFVVRRIFFLPPLVDNIYINYFFDAPKILWSSSRLGLGIIDNPYDLPAPFLIGLDIFGAEGMSANTGIIGSGYSHAGITGVVIYSVLFGLLVSLINEFGKKIGHEIVFASSISIVISILISTDFTTAILTHGLLILIILFVIFPHAIAKPREVVWRSI